MELKKYKLADIADFNKSSISKSETFKEIIYLDTSSITENVVSGTVIMNTKEAPSRAQRTVTNNTIIYSTVRPRLKHYGILSRPQNNFIVSTGFTTIDIKDLYKDKIDPRYLYLLLTQPTITDYIGNIADTAVSAYPSINPSDLSSLCFMFPDHDIQKTIADIWNNYDRKIELNRAINQNLEAMAKQLYDYWFVQFDFPNEDGKPYKSSGGEMIWNESLKREIPKGWITTTINGVCTSCRGVSYGKDDLLPNGNGILVLRGNNIENNHIVYDSNVAFVPYDFINEEQRIKEGDIVMTMSSGSKAHVGKCAMFYKDSEHTFGAFLSKFTPKKEMRYMIFLFLTSEYFKSLITAFCNGTGINNLTNQTFDDVILVLPNENTLQQFESKVKPLFDIIGNNEENIEILTKQRNELLPLLMNGQVSINSDLYAY